MADIQDYLAASRDTDVALSALDALDQSIVEGPDFQSALATVAAGRAVALAIREASVRHDYLAHALAKGARG